MEVKASSFDHIVLQTLRRIFFENWPRKLVALITAIIVWFLVNQTLTLTKTYTDVPVRVINLPEDKTISEMLPNGLLKKKVSVTVTGTKSVLEELNPNDLEIVINAKGKKESWIAKIDQQSLMTASSNIDLKKNLVDVSGNDFFIKLSDVVTDEILVTITKPIGEPPKGYQFLDVWPKYLRQKVKGAQEEVQALKEHGLQLTFDLNKIPEDELNQLLLAAKASNTDEINYYIPQNWKEIAIPFKEGQLEMINDPAAKYLRFVLLKQELLSLGIELPITIFFPVKYSRTINPQTYSLQTNDIVQKKNGLKLLTHPLYVQDVSRLFLDVVRNNLLLTIIATPKQSQDELDWTLLFIDQKALEDSFVKKSLREAQKKQETSAIANPNTPPNEEYLRSNFRHFVRNFKLYLNKNEPLDLSARLEEDQIILKINE